MTTWLFSMASFCPSLMIIIISSLKLSSSLPFSSPSSFSSIHVRPVKYQSFSDQMNVLTSSSSLQSTGWTSSCQPYYISYESCLLLLNLSSSCNAAYYVHKMCHLLDLNMNLSWPFIENNEVNQDEIDGVYLSKSSLLPPRDSTTTTTSHPLINETDESSSVTSRAIKLYQQCLHSHPPNYIPPSNFDELPRLNIVISTSASWKSKNVEEFSKAISHWKCYAKIHGYNFTLNMINSRDPSDFFVSRHESIQTSHLPYAQYILHLDADSVILNVSRSMEPFLQLNSSVILQVRENFEVTSALYIVKNDLKGYCFLDYWRRFHPPRTADGGIIAVPNHCNGALVASILHLAVPGPKIANCLSAHYSSESKYTFLLRNRKSGSVAHISAAQYLAYYNLTDYKSTRSFTPEQTLLLDSYPPAVAQVIEVNHHSYGYPEHDCLHRYIEYVYVLGTSSPTAILPSLQHVGVYILWQQEGLWRSHEKEPQTAHDWYIERFRRCFPTNDLIGHGDKLIATHMYYPPHSNQCDLSFATNGKGANPKCKWHETHQPMNSTSKDSSPGYREHDFELRTLQKYCYFSSPKCYQWNATLSAEENICIPNHPLFPSRFRINHCTPLISPRGAYLYSLQSWRQRINYSLY